MRIRAHYLMVGLAIMGVSSPAHAQTASLTERFSLDHFTPGTPGGSILGVRSANVPLHLGSELALSLDYGHRPLVAQIRTDDELTTVDIVAGRWTSHLGYTLGLFDLVSLEADMPIVLSQSGAGLGSDPREGTGDAVSAFAIGDMMLGAKLQALHAGPVRLGVGGRLWLPTGDDDGFVSDGAVRGAPFAVLDVQAGPVLAAVDVAYAIRGQRLAHNFRSDDAFEWGIGARWRAVSELDVEASIRGAVSPFDAPSVEETLNDGSLPYPVEALAGAAWTIGDFRLSAAAGPGLNAAVGNPRFRVLFGLAYALDPQKSRPIGDDDTAGQAAKDAALRADTDGDGFDGLTDMCPDEVGPNQGCAVRDTDGDGVEDGADACPTRPEDVDTFEDEDGCPDPDNDGDGFPDETDQCPLEAEVINGRLDDDGCPDTVDADIEVQSNRIEVRQSVYFDTDRATIKQRSLAILTRVAQTLKEHPELTKLSIEGHTDDRGSASHNLDLSARRAEAVRQFLISEGVEKSRLKATGYGESHPVGDNSTEEGRGQNRRVEFLITERED